MKKEVFEFQGQHWVAVGIGELTVKFELWRPEPWIEVKTRFVPTWMLEREAQNGQPRPDAEHPTLSLEIGGHVAPLSQGWRSLARTRMVDAPPTFSQDGRMILFPRFRAEVQLLIGPPHSDPRTRVNYTPYLPEESEMAFGEWSRHEAGGDEIDYRVEAFFATERAARERGKQRKNAVAEWRGKRPRHRVDESLLNEGWRFTWRGRAVFTEVRCEVPLNARDAVDYASTLAERNLGRSDWVRGRLAGPGDRCSVPGLSDRGQFVILEVPR